ncbi:hypothetical protein Egran_05006, partial [Elaphomyces granulatus]
MASSNSLRGLVEEITDDFSRLGGGPSLPAVFQADEKLIIALDFGTTFSGIAYCFVNQRDAKVAAIMDWPGASGQSVPKIPTLIRYDPDNNKKFAWGASANRTSDSVKNNIVGVKLLLDPSQERPCYLPTENLLKDLSMLPKQPVEIAAKVAGIFPVTLIKEPEAAALYTIHSLGFALSAGDAFVVCDAGGGTVDLISYEVVSLTPVLQLKELVPGTGGMAGSLGLNQRFAESVKRLVGDDQWEVLRQSRGFFHAQKSFETEVKRSFRGHADEEYFITFPMATLEDNPEAGLEANCWTMTGKDLEDIYEPLIADVLKLIDEQVTSAMIKRPGRDLRGIFLVGGFGSSQYLKTRVEKRHPGIQVLQPMDAWAAIVKGAALSKLPREAAIISTCAARHYGVEAWDTYDAQLDGDVERKKWRDGSTRAAIMTWYINIGDDILRDQKIKFPFYRMLDETYNSSSLLFKDILYECQDQDPPRNRCKGKRIGPNCELTADLRSVPSSQFVRATDSQGKPYYRVHYDLVVSLASALMNFSLEIDGKSMGSVEAKF